MTDGEWNVVGIGNAIVDVLANAEDRFLTDRGLVKGSMNLIDGEQADSLYREMDQGMVCSGGSAANTMVGIASLGGRAAFIGKVRDDDLGEVFRRRWNTQGHAVVSSPGISFSGRCTHT